jgi:hypothetical protein
MCTTCIGDLNYQCYSFQRAILSVKQDSSNVSTISDSQPGEDSPKLLNVAAWQLLTQLGSEILLQLVLGRRKARLGCPDIWHSPIPVWQLPESLLAENLLHSQLVDTSVETVP